MESILKYKENILLQLKMCKTQNEISSDEFQTAKKILIVHVYRNVIYSDFFKYIIHVVWEYVVVVCSGLTSLSTIFLSYNDGVWLRQGVQCCLTALSCPRHLT